MTFETYDKDKHTLEVGTKIRLAGREGEIIMTDEEHKSLKHLVEWPDSDYKIWFNLPIFTFEVAIPPAPPLTIDKRVKEELIAMVRACRQSPGCSNGKENNIYGCNCPMLRKEADIEDYLKSLEET